MSKVYFDNEGMVNKYPKLFKHESTLGMQSMSQVVNLKLHNLAHLFVGEYLENGHEVAMLWLADKASAEEMVEMRGYVELAFDKAGYRVK